MSAIAESLYSLRRRGSSLAAGSPPPPAASAGAAFDAYAAAVAGLRRDRLTLALPDRDAERIFAMSFGPEQLRRNIGDITHRAEELAGR